MGPSLDGRGVAADGIEAQANALDRGAMEEEATIDHGDEIEFGEFIPL